MQGVNFSLSGHSLLLQRYTQIYTHTADLLQAHGKETE